MTFKETHNFEKRKSESIRIRAKYPNRVPVIVERGYESTVTLIDKCKYLVPSDLTCGQLIYMIRMRIKLQPEDALFMFFGNSLAPSNQLMSAVYEQYKDEDMFLYATYSGESTFGCMGGS
jgi:GABA(A) receptor-associated protein